MFHRLPVAVAALLAFALVSPVALAAPPRIVGRARVTNPSFHGFTNTMIYDVRVTVDGTGAAADHGARVGFVPTSDYTTCSDASVAWKWASSQTFDTTTVRTWSLYNFVPGTAYTYKVEVNPSGTTRVRCGDLTTAAAPTPRLATYLSRLNLQYAKSGAPYDTRYALFETNDCGQDTPGGPHYYVVAVDVDAETIVWYLDVEAMTGITNASGSGFHYHEGPTPQEDRILLTVDKRSMYEWAFDGTTVHSRDFAPLGECSGMVGSAGPCMNHDVFKSYETGDTYMLVTRASSLNATDTAWESKCGSGSRFLEDGFRVIDEDWNDVAQYSLMADYGYDPTIDGGPDDVAVAARPDACDSRSWGNSFDPAYGMIEWTHVNSISTSSVGGDEVIDLSLREWDQILRFDASTGDLLWRLSPNDGYSDWPVRKEGTITGRAAWQAQHDVHSIAKDTLMFLDNTGGGVGSRVLEVELRSAPVSATVTKSWAVVDAAGDPLTCTAEGSAQQVPDSDHVLAMCATHHAIAELEDPTGSTGTPPPLLIEVSNGRAGAPDICTTGGPTSIHDMHGWHKAYPAARLGEF